VSSQSADVNDGVLRKPISPADAFLFRNHLGCEAIVVNTRWNDHDSAALYSQEITNIIAGCVRDGDDAVRTVQHPTEHRPQQDCICAAPRSSTERDQIVDDKAGRWACLDCETFLCDAVQHVDTVIVKRGD
jgi:hypothetical protein